MRYVFNASLIWAEELCRYILVWMTFLLVGMAFHRGELVAVEIVTGALPPWARLALKALVTVPVILFLGFIVFFGWRFASRMGIQTIPALDFMWSALGGKEEAEISVFWIYISAPVGCALLIGHMLISLVLEARAVMRGEAIEPAVSTH
jgi:TRAP-type C4-dicarboxylate transport system permease small subunit